MADEHSPVPNAMGSDKSEESSPTPSRAQIAEELSKFIQRIESLRISVNPTIGTMQKARKRARADFLEFLHRHATLKGSKEKDGKMVATFVVNGEATPTADKLERIYDNLTCES
ncbi:hypothetical protein [Nitrospira sp. Nam74]